MLLDRSKLQLKIWFKSAWLNCCSIDAGSIECDFWSIKPIFRPIKNCSQSFLKNISSSCVLHYFKTFQKAFWFSLFDRSNSSKFFSFSLNFFLGFLSSSTSKTFLSFPFQFNLILHAFFHAFKEKFRTYRNLEFLIFEMFFVQIDQWVFVLRWYK